MGVAGKVLWKYDHAPLDTLIILALPASVRATVGASGPVAGAT